MQQLHLAQFSADEVRLFPPIPLTLGTYFVQFAKRERFGERCNFRWNRFQVDPSLVSCTSSTAGPSYSQILRTVPLQKSFSLL